MKQREEREQRFSSSVAKLWKRIILFNLTNLTEPLEGAWDSYLVLLQ
jgi:hypothetical protein